MDMLRVVAERHRRDILQLVWDRELTAGEIAASFELTFGAVSQHLGVLRRAGCVDVRRDGNRRHYRANRAALGPLRQVLEQMWANSIDRLAQLAEREEAEAR